MKKQGQVGKIGKHTEGGNKAFKGSRIEGKKGILNKPKDIKKEERKDGNS